MKGALNAMISLKMSQKFLSYYNNVTECVEDAFCNYSKLRISWFVFLTFTPFSSSGIILLTLVS